jgi:hypothetical protein
MQKPGAEGQFTSEPVPTSAEEKITADQPAVSPGPGSAPAVPTYAWWLVLALVGLDSFSTLAYLPTIAVTGATDMAPLAAIAVSLLLLFVALPIYLYIVGRSPHGRGATGLLESCVSGWSGKILLLFLLGFVATDILMTRSVSLASASAHLLASPHAHAGIDWVQGRKQALYAVLPDNMQGERMELFFAWWDDQLIVTLVLTILGFALFFYLLRGFTRGFMVTAASIVGLFLLVNGVVIGSGLIYLFRHPDYINNWLAIYLEYGSENRDPLELTITIVFFAVKYLPWLALGLSGFELSMANAPLVRGRPDDDPERPRGRIRNARKMLVMAAVLMGLLVPASVATVSFLVPRKSLGETGLARHRALAYLAHGGTLQPLVLRARLDPEAGERAEREDEPGDAPRNPPNEPDEGKNESREPSIPPLTGSDLNPLFGPVFGTLYDLSAVLILFLAGASVTISLRELLPQYLARYGMQMHWTHRIGILLHVFNFILLYLVIASRASVSGQQALYATCVLMLLAGAALAAALDLSNRLRHSVFRPVVTAPLILICGAFLLLAWQVVSNDWTGAAIPLLLILGVFFSAGLSRWMRSTELRYDGFTYADEESGVRWEQIRRMEFQVLVPHHPGKESLAEKEAAIRARHRLGPDVPIIFVEVQLGDPSDFQQHPLMQIVKEDGHEIIRVSQCSSIAHVLAAIALEFREVGRPPEIHFTWSEESPLASNLNFLLWGVGNVPWMVHSLIRKAEPDPDRQPRVVIG